MLKSLVRWGFNRMPTSVRYEIFYQAARSLGVESYSVAGAAGAFAGPAFDVTIMKSYLEGVVWPAREIAIIKAFFAGRPGTLYDIGANIGMVTVPLTQCGVSVVAFEPDPLNCSLLRANIVRNCPNGDVTVKQQAVYSERKTLRFTKSAYNSGDHRLAETGEIEVEGVVLDDLPLPASPFAIKIDTQGAEPGIFAGGEATIAAADMVVAEFWPFGMARMGNKPDAILEAVRRFPFTRLVNAAEPKWISGAELADLLAAARGDMDFVLAKQPFDVPN